MLEKKEASLGGNCKKCGSPTIKLSARQSQCVNSDCKYMQS